ncbi:hypothetical protein [Vibrio phage phiKT1019]|nr:hypothetical protein [Vibrio phage phiKT1019]
MTSRVAKPVNVYANIKNDWGYPDEVFEIVVDHLCSLLTSTKMNPEEIYEDLHITVHQMLDVSYNPKIHDKPLDYIVMTNIENTFLETVDLSKDLLDLTLEDHDDLKGVYMANISDVEYVMMSPNRALLCVTIIPPGDWLWKQTPTQNT